jgi:iron complex outermembrane receptor protein
MTKQSVLIFAAAILVPPFMAAAAQADDAASEPAADAKPVTDRLEEVQLITVTGRKPLIDNKNVTLGAFGNKDVMEIPLSIQSYSAVLLENSRARTLLDVTSNDPGVQDGRVNGSYSNLRIRGFSTDWTNTIRRDGLSLAPYQDVPLEGVDQVTVLKGPSGFLYGFNSPGGTINYITKRPTRDAFSEVTLEGRTDHGWYVHLDTSNTVGADKNFGYRFNVGHEDVGDFTHNLDSRRSFATASVDWKLNEDAVLQLNADYQRKEAAAQPVIGIAGGKLPPMYDPRTLLGEPWLQYQTDVYNVGSRLDYSFSSNWSLTAQAAYSSNTRYTAFPRLAGVNDNGDIIGGTNSRIDISPDQTYRTISGQVFVTGEVGFLGVKHEVVAGVSGVDYKAREAGYMRLPITVGNIFEPVYVPEPTLPARPAKNHNDVTQASPFTSDLITFGEHWQSLIGARYIRFKNTLTVPATAPTVYERNEVVPNFGLIYKPVPDVMTYFDYTRGLEQSGVAPPFAVNAGVTLAPLVSTQYEVGAKALIAHNFNLGLAVFQINKTLEFVNDALVFEQDGRQRHRGVELSANGQLSHDLTVIAGVARLFTTQIDTNDPTVNGQQTPNAPNWQANLSLDYQLRSVHGLFFSGAVSYVGGRAVDASNTIIAPSFTTMDLGARYVTTLFNQNVIFRANVKNLANRRYWGSAESLGVFPGTPRTAYLSMQIEL